MSAYSSMTCMRQSRTQVYQKLKVLQKCDSAKDLLKYLLNAYIFRVWGGAPAAQRFLAVVRCKVVTFIEQNRHYAMTGFLNT